MIDFYRFLLVIDMFLLVIDHDRLLSKSINNRFVLVSPLVDMGCKLEAGRKSWVIYFDPFFYI